MNDVIWETDNSKVNEVVNTWETNNSKVDEVVNTWEKDNSKVDQVVNTWETDFSWAAAISFILSSKLHTYKI